MRVLVFDVEAAGVAKANPFSVGNRLCCVGLFDGINYSFVDIEHGLNPYAVGLEQIAQAFAQAELVIAFNAKYDLHWLRRYIPDLRIPPCWDCQLAQFILDSQTNAYPSLDDVLRKYSLPCKDDRIKREYWDQGRSTLEVPIELLREYNEYDCTGTYQVYLRQRDLLKDNNGNPSDCRSGTDSAKRNMAVLFRLHCDDLLVLEEMEFNGLLYDSEESLRLAESIGEQLKGVYEELRPFVQSRDVNWNSPKQCSAVLYGGSIPFRLRQSTCRTLKSGEIKRGERWGEEHVEFPRLCEPIEKTQLADGTWSTDEATLRSLKASGPAQQLIKLILKVSELDKLKGTYYEGMPKIINKMEWPKNMIHGNINQCVTKTGRTASSKPNIQQTPSALKPLFKSRYVD